MNKELTEPIFKIEDGWIAYDSPYSEKEPSFVSNVSGHKGLRAKYYKKPDESLIGKAWFGPLAKGPPGHAHGGSQAALLDDAMGTAAWLLEIPVVAANIDINFKAMLPLSNEVYIEARVERREGRKVYTTGRIFSGDGTIYATGEGLFLELKPEQIKKLEPFVKA